jgi:galactokinase
VTDIRDEARAGFIETFGAGPTGAGPTGTGPEGTGPIGLWSAPGVVTIPGPGIQSAFSFAIDRRLVVAVRLHELDLEGNDVVRIASSLADGIVEVSFAELSQLDDQSDGLGRPGELWEGWAAPVIGVIVGFDPDLARTNISPLTARQGFDLYIESDVPVAAGLGSSAALEVATALALNELWEFGFDRESLAMTGAGRDTFVRAGALRETVDPAEVFRRFSTPVTTESAYFLPEPGSEPAIPEGDLAVLVLAEETDAEANTYDLALETLRSNGAIGAQPAGDGITIALTTFDELSRLQVAIDSAFAEHGSAQPATFVVVPSTGAVREK